MEGIDGEFGKLSHRFIAVAISIDLVSLRIRGSLCLMLR